MYVPQFFEETQVEVLHALVAQHPLGILCTHGAAGLDANHLPFELQPREGELGSLHTHVARANPVWREVTDGDEVLVVFRAADAYISPNWYPSKLEHHQVVPTWNYSVVHAHGRVTIHEDERYLRGLVGRLTRTHEANEPQPWRMGDSPQEFIEAMLTRIVGIEIGITRLVGKFKLGQNRELRDAEGAGQALKSRGQHAVGDAMLARAAARTPKPE